VERAHAADCKVFPGIEGQLHWCVASGGGGTGLRPGNGVEDGFGPPSLAYMRAVAATHYLSGADGISLYNFTCADGAFSRAALVDLADPRALVGKDKQVVLALWPPDAQIFNTPWTSSFRLDQDQLETARELRITDDLDGLRRSGQSCIATLTVEWKGLNRLSDVEISLNSFPLVWDGYSYNHYDHGCWNDIVRYAVPVKYLHRGQNTLGLRRIKPSLGFAGAIEVRKCVLDLCFDRQIALGALDRPEQA
jgi:hypothetical protein